MNSRLYNSPAGKVFDIFNYVMLGILGILTVLPFLYIIGNSFATEAEITERSFSSFRRCFPSARMSISSPRPRSFAVLVFPFSSRWQVHWSICSSH